MTLLAKGEGVILSPIYIEDLSKIFLKIIESKKRFDNEIINVSSQEIVSLEKIIKILSENLKINPKIEQTDNELKYFISNSNFGKTLCQGAQNLGLHKLLIHHLPTNSIHLPQSRRRREYVSVLDMGAP